ncbi:MAG: FHA domain-containing protein, partial [Planctomycetota bacterium]
AALVVQARQHFAERDLAEAERLVEAARAQWLDGDDARALAEELRIVRAGIDTLEHVETMTRERDFLGARQKLGALPATSPFLRTRIYDMKKDLAKAQGLEGAFLLRVDEGGEHLVLRGESITIGNVRQNRADLPVLANVAGRHASIRRSMSFHGGMQDTVVAEEGEVAVGGRKVKDQPLSPGDRVQLGPALGFVYRRPCARSLTVGLVLQSGFQVGGTDRVLLMKDRGRDGRILIGAGQDVHIRVGAATAEVEVYATGSGQIRVACPAGGTLDGVPWKDEHPLAAGQTVVAAGVTFTLLPWRPAA